MREVVPSTENIAPIPWAPELGLALVDFLSSPWGSVAVAAALTLVICAESRWLPWAPYFLIYALLAPAVPVLLGGWSPGNLPALWRDHGPFILGAAAAMLIWEVGIATWLYEWIWLPARGHDGDPRHSPTHSLNLLAETAGRSAGLGPKASAAVFGCYSLVWAPVAEELFYWGYLYANLREGTSFWTASLITSFFFGIRHMAHFLFLKGRFPWPAAVWLAASTAITALINSLLFEKIQALTPLILIHLTANVLFALYAASLPRPENPPPMPDRPG